MKKILVLVLAGILTFSVAAIAGLTGTPHQLGTEICVACHTPHAAIAGYGPLWNRNDSGGTYTLYTSATFTGTNAANALGGQSLACMTCHNGLASTIVNGPGTDAGTTAPYNLAAGQVNGFANVGQDLTNDHPVGFTYSAGTTDPDGGDVWPAVVAGKINNVYPIYSGQMECATCHDVHNSASYAGQGSTQVYFLRATNVNSAMCTTCHTNKL